MTKKIFIASITALLMISANATLAQDAFSTIEERMTGKEFNSAGLSKLTPEELAALNSWLRARSVATLDSANPNAGSGSPTQGGADARGFETQTSAAISDQDIVSVVKGQFSGWTGDTIFELENGMVWQQVETGTFYIPATTGAVVVIDKGILNSWRLSAQGYNKTIRVRRLE